MTQSRIAQRSEPALVAEVPSQASVPASVICESRDAPESRRAAPDTFLQSLTVSMRTPAAAFVATALLLALSAGCGGKPKESPERAFQDFYGALALFGMEQDVSFQRAAFELLCEPARRTLEDRAKELNAKLTEGSHIEASSLLVPLGPVLPGKYTDVRLVKSDDTSAVVEATFATGKVQATLCREGERWLIQLPSFESPRGGETL